MALWQEIDRLRKDPGSMRALATYLLSLVVSDATPWEIDFLRSITMQPHVEHFSTRQAEKILQIRDDYEDVSKFRGFSVRILVEKCRLGALDLDEDDELWIKNIPVGATTVKRRNIGRLLRCARSLGLIEEEAA